LLFVNNQTRLFIWILQRCLFGQHFFCIWLLENPWHTSGIRYVSQLGKPFDVNDNVYYYRGVCCELTGKITEARAGLNKAKKCGNKNADAKIKKLCGNSAG